jgi:hypothetical protein
VVSMGTVPPTAAQTSALLRVSSPKL